MKIGWKESDTDMAQDYNATLNLPKTAFPMRGNLPKREPDVLGKWEEQDLYEKKESGSSDVCFTRWPAVRKRGNSSWYSIE